MVKINNGFYYSKMNLFIILKNINKTIIYVILIFIIDIISTVMIKLIESNKI